MNNQAGFLELGITYQLVDTAPDSNEQVGVWHVIEDGALIKTCKYRGTALIELASLIDKKIGVSAND